MNIRRWGGFVLGFSIVLLLPFLAFAQEVQVGNAANADSGIFNVLSSQTLSRGKFAGALVFDNFDRDPLDIDETDYRVGLGFGVTDWLELHASLDAYRVLDIDPKEGPGFYNNRFIGENSAATGIGDLQVGLKVRLVDVMEKGFGVAFVGHVKVPTASDEEGTGTGKVDFDLRGVVEANFEDLVGFYGNVGVLLASDADLHEVGNQIVFGGGLVIPYRSRIQLLGELYGASVNDAGQIDDYVDLTVGLRFFVTQEINLTLGVRRNLSMNNDLKQRPDGAVFTLGYWPQRRVVTFGAPETLPSPKEPPPPPVELPPVITPPPAYAPQEIYFAFDKYELRDSEISKLDDMVKYLQEHPDIPVTIEGHTCYIGTEEYNMALGLHRAEAVRQYLIDHGIAADRIETISYGETQAKYDNSREVTRRFNRRAWFVIKEEKPQS